MLRPRPRFHGRHKHTSRWRRRVLLVLLILVLAGSGAVYYVTRPQRLAAFAADLIGQSLGAQTTIDRATFSWSGRIELEGVTVSVPGVPGDGGRLFSADNILLDPQIADLIRGRLNVASAVIVRPTAYITENTDEGLFNFQMLAQQDSTEDDENLPLVLPELFLRHASIAFGMVENGQYRALDELNVDGRVNKSPDSMTAYTFSFRQPKSGGEPGPTVTGRFDLGDKSFSVALKQFTFDRPERHFLSKDVRLWWDRLEPAGAIPSLDVEYSPTTGLVASLSIEHGQLTIPYEKFRSRMTDVSGSFRIEEDRFTATDVTGLIEGIRYHIDGTVDGLALDAPFDFTLKTDVFELEKNPGFVEDLPHQVREHFDRYNPSGKFQLAVALKRLTPANDANADPGKPDVLYDGTLTLVDARAAFYRFAYPVHGVTGAVHLTNDRADVLDITGYGPDGGKIIVAGSILPPWEAAKVDITVTGQGVPLDQTLSDAMDPGRREIFPLFLNRPAYGRLLAEKVIRPTPSPGEDKAATPAFDLGGAIDLDVEIKRPFGKDSDYTLVTTIHPAGVGVVFKYWPYPVTITGGSIVANKQGVRVNTVTARGPTGAEVTVKGNIPEDGPGQPLRPDITISEAAMPIDPLLVATLPDAKSEWLNRLHLTGELRGDGSVSYTKDRGIGFEVLLDLADATAEPFGQGKLITDIAGKAAIDADHIEIRDLTARHDQAVITASAEVRFGDEQESFNIDLTAKDLDIDHDLLAWLPPKHHARDTLRQLLDDYSPRGTIDGSVHLAGTMDKGADEFHATVQPAQLAFDYNNHRFAFETMTGNVTVKADSIDFDALGGAYADGRLTASGFVHFHPQRRAAVNFTGYIDGIGESTRALLPEYVLNAMDAIQINGKINIDSGRLQYDPGVADKPAFSFASKLAITDTRARIGVPITELKGTLDVKVIDRPNADGPKIDIGLNADQLRAADRLIAPFTMGLVTDKDMQRLRLEDCRGNIYGGMFVGEGWLDLSATGGFAVDLKIHDTDSDSFIYPQKARTKSDPGSLDSGRLSASLALEAEYEDESTRRGRGAMNIVDAHLYDNALALVLLRTLNLSLPTARSFRSASARYVINGNDVVLDELSLSSPSLEFIGGGTMEWNTLSLDLNMYTRNPSPLLPTPVGQVYNIFLDEITAIHVGGTLDDPRANLAPLGVIRRSWSSVFGGTRARDTDAGPLLPATATP